MGRGDLTDGQWRRLRPLLPAQKSRTGRPGRDHRQSSTGSCGFCAPAPPGGICPRALASGPWWPAVSTDGGSRDCGTGSWLRCSGKPMPWGRLSGKCITWTAPACGRISTQLEQKGGGRSGAGPFPRRVRDQNPPPIELRAGSEGRGRGQAGGLGADSGSTARGQRVPCSRS